MCMCVQVIKEKIGNNSLSKMCTFKLLILPSPTWFPAAVILGKCFFIYTYCCRPFRKFIRWKCDHTYGITAIKSKLVNSHYKLLILVKWKVLHFSKKIQRNKINQTEEKKLWLSTRRWNSLQLQSNWLKFKKPLWPSIIKAIENIVPFSCCVCLFIEKKKNGTKFEWQA